MLRKKIKTLLLIGTSMLSACILDFTIICPDGGVADKDNHCTYNGTKDMGTPTPCSASLAGLLNNNALTTCYYKNPPGTYAFACANIQENSTIDTTQCNATCTMQQDGSRRGLKGLVIHPTQGDTFSAILLNTDGSPALEVMCTVMN
jgi:hypothetical protein